MALCCSVYQHITSFPAVNWLGVVETDACMFLGERGAIGYDGHQKDLAWELHTFQLEDTAVYDQLTGWIGICRVCTVASITTGKQNVPVGLSLAHSKMMNCSVRSLPPKGKFQNRPCRWIFLSIFVLLTEKKNQDPQPCLGCLHQSWLRAYDGWVILTKN